MSPKLIKVLLVEAFPDNIKMIHQILQKEYSNYILEITDTKEGLEQVIQKHNPDIILSNNIFPDFEGKSIFKRAKKLAPKTPFIFVSYAPREESLIYFFKKGLTDFILKENIENLPFRIKLALKKSQSKIVSNHTRENLQKRINELEKNRYLFRTAAENKNTIFVLVDENLIPIYRSPLVERITGWSTEEMYGYLFFELVHPEERDSVYNFLSEIKENPGKILSVTFRFKLKNGYYSWFEGTGTNQLHDSKLHGIILKFNDISDRKKLQTELAEKEAKYRSIFENTLDGIILSQTDGRIISANPAAIHAEAKFISKTGREIWTHIKANPLFDENNALQGALAMFTDISESKRVALELERFNNDLATQINFTQKRQAELIAVNKELSDYKYAINESCIVAIANQKGIISYVNDNFCAISKYSKEELIGQDLRITCSGYHSKEYIQGIWQTISQGETWKGELKNRAKDGTIYWVDTTIIPFLDEKGAPYQYVATRFDITERKKAEIDLDLQCKKLIKTNKELDRFVYSVSHDLRSPLTSILGLINFIEEESGEPDTIKHILMIRESVNRLDNFIKCILSYSRNNRMSLKVRKISLQKQINEIVNSCMGNPDYKNIEFMIDIMEQQPFYTDVIRLNTIIENLISNAIKYHKEEGTNNFIKISCYADSECLKLTIADNGIGIDPKHHTKIFEMFYRLASKKVGSGIGLYIVKDTVEMLEGTIAIDSELTKGTCFIIKLKNLKS
ncbi:MAG: PAS domain S-box-containing protein [Flavobacteriales bacterium]|jgi:PAS domain S-box-containing protein